MRWLVASAALAMLAACGGGSSQAQGDTSSVSHPPIGQEPGHLQVYDYAGYEVKPLWRPYAKEHPTDPPKWKFLNSDAEALSTATAGCSYRGTKSPICRGPSPEGQPTRRAPASRRAGPP